MKTKEDTYETAKYYSTPGGEDNLTHESPEDAIIKWVSDLLDCDPKEWESEICRFCPITVTGYQLEPPSEVLQTFWAAELSENCLEKFHETYGDPECDPIDPDLTIMESFRKAVTTVVNKSHCWRCKAVGSRRYSSNEVLSITKEIYPEWFE